MAYYPVANQTIKGNSSGAYSGGPYKGVLHTTEGGSASGAINAFKTNNSWPHFLIDYSGAVWQFIDTSQAARALRNLAGGVETNRDSAIQIEVVGFAGKPTEHPVVQVEGLKALMRWIEANTGVKPIGPGRPFASAYGQSNLRFTDSEWDSFGGWCGHCHCPEQDHWDPGAIDINTLLPPLPVVSYSPEVPVPFTLSRPQGGYIVVGSDGGVFTYDGAPFFGSLPGIKVVAKVVSAAWSPTGQGYWILGEDGAVYGFGDAAYKGGYNSFDAATRGSRKPIGIVAVGSGYKIVALDPSNDGTPFDTYAFGA